MHSCMRSLQCMRAHVTVDPGVSILVQLGEHFRAVGHSPLTRRGGGEGTRNQSVGCAHVCNKDSPDDSVISEVLEWRHA